MTIELDFYYTKVGLGDWSGRAYSSCRPRIGSSSRWTNEAAARPTHCDAAGPQCVSVDERVAYAPFVRRPFRRPRLCRAHHWWCAAYLRGTLYAEQPAGGSKSALARTSLCAHGLARGRGGDALRAEPRFNSDGAVTPLRSMCGLTAIGGPQVIMLPRPPRATGKQKKRRWRANRTKVPK